MEIFISLPLQTLELFGDDQQLLRRYTISTAINGAGEQNGSFKTPRGKHLIRAKIGTNCPANTVFVRRRPTGEIWSSALHAQLPDRDWILTRILWLSGRQSGFNRCSSVDTMRRYVYLHGTHDLAQMGVPGSIGCVRMRNADIIELFDLVPPYIHVNIGEYHVSTESVDVTACQTLLTPQQTAFSPNQKSQCIQALDATGQLIGALTWQHSHLGTSMHVAAMVVVNDLVVSPEWRRKGVAANLLRCLLETASVSLEQLDLQALGRTSDGQALLSAFCADLSSANTLV